jgi:hypothetical protein
MRFAGRLERNRLGCRLRASEALALQSRTLYMPTDQRSDPKSLLISNVSTLQSGKEI